MDALQAALLGLIQGLTEFLPVSSSGHLIATRWLLGWDDPGLAFDVALHAGTLIAVLLYFRHDWLRLARASFACLRGLRTRSTSSNTGPADACTDARLAWFILLATIPGVVAGALGERRLEELFHGTTPSAQATGIVIVGVVMILMAGLLLLAERIAVKSYEMAQLTLPRAMLIGLAQAFAIIPGVSRSGSTITAGLFMNLRREAAARFSFLLGTPIIVGASLKQFYEIAAAGGLPDGEMLTFALGFVSAAASGYAAIYLLMHFLQRHSTIPFVIYRVAFGLLLIASVVALPRG